MAATFQWKAHCADAANTTDGGKSYTLIRMPATDYYWRTHCFNATSRLVNGHLHFRRRVAASHGWGCNNWKNWRRCTAICTYRCLFELRDCVGFTWRRFRPVRYIEGVPDEMELAKNPNEIMGQCDFYTQFRNPKCEVWTGSAAKAQFPGGIALPHNWSAQWAEEKFSHGSVVMRTDTSETQLNLYNGTPWTSRHIESADERCETRAEGSEGCTRGPAPDGPEDHVAGEFRWYESDPEFIHPPAQEDDAQDDS
ncbi:unnamed protein product [Amoebophrya sp. A25]|nr:unnamed protein product [Amoebophrya sp. A25]|eukprot:GSA25T00002167001.1